MVAGTLRQSQANAGDAARMTNPMIVRVVSVSR
jgi:hypothetical protein